MEHPQVYNADKPYAWNYVHAPAISQQRHDDIAFPGQYSFCGLPARSPLGVPAGPLLNGRWCLHYAALGFDVVTYKTVRSGYRACYDLPNLQPVHCGPLDENCHEVPAAGEMNGSWAVSFGMPSSEPSTWRADVAYTRRRLASDKLLVVSVVGTVRPEWTLDDLAADYARCAAWAIDAGADAVEANLSCPNVATCDGQLYQQPADARRVAMHLRHAIGNKPLILKVGHVNRRDDAIRLLEHVAPYVNGLAMTNSIVTTVRAPDGSVMFDGQRRGICGKATFAASIAQTEMFAREVDRRRLDLDLIGVGGASCHADVAAYLNAGAAAVHLATAAMTDPLVALRIKREMNAST